jgi:Transposase IS116/IS110/IS902 family
MLHYAQDQLAKLPTEIRDQLPTTGKIESRLRRLEAIDTTIVSTQAGAYRLSWLLPLIDQDRAPRRQARALERRIDELRDAHGTTLRDEPGIGPIAAATLLVEVGDPFRSPASPSSPAGAAPGPLRCPRVRATGRRHGTASTSAATAGSTASSTSPASPSNATTMPPASTSSARPTKARPDEKPAGRTSGTSPIASSVICGPTNADDQPLSRWPLDKGARRRPGGVRSVRRSYVLSRINAGVLAHQ